MSKFEDYNASQIVPQRTLLEKFNKIIEYLKQNPGVNIYYVNTNYIDEETVYNISDLQLGIHSLSVSDIVIFSNNYYSVVNFIGSNVFMVETATNFRGETGPQGPQGIQGPQGPQGPQGNSITNVVINNLNQLIITLSNGDTITTGAVDYPIITLSTTTGTLTTEEYEKIQNYRCLIKYDDELFYKTEEDNFYYYFTSIPRQKGGGTFYTGYLTISKSNKYFSIYVDDTIQGNPTLPSGVIPVLRGLKIGSSWYRNQNLEDIVDKDGHNRFIEGEISLSQYVINLGCEKLYGKWSLSGSHLLIVLAFSVPANVAISGDNTMGNLISLPSFIYNKITPIANDYIVVNKAQLYKANWGIPTEVNTVLRKVTNSTAITLRTNITADTDIRYMRAQFDLIIDDA